MKEWKYPLVRFENVAKKVSLNFDSSKSDLKRFVAGEHMYTNRLDIDTWGEIGSQYLGPAFNSIFNPGHILYGSRRTYLRKVSQPDFSGVCSNTTFVIEPIESELNAKLLPYLMLSNIFAKNSIARSKGSTNPYINWKDIASFQFRVPSPMLQEMAISILEKIQEEIKHLRKSLHNYELLQRKIKRKILLECDGVEKSLDQLITIHYGDSLPKSKRNPGDIPIISSAGKSGSNDKANVSKSGIVIGRKGNAGSVFWAEGPHFVIDTAFHVQVNDQNVSEEFLYNLLSVTRFERYIITTTVPGISRDDIYSHKVIIPTMEMQQLANEKIKELANEKGFIQHRLNHLSELMLSITNRIFGE